MDKVRQQDYMFVEWSKGLNRDTFDVDIIISNLQKRGGGLRILDVGGGIGAFATILAESLEEAHITVIDLSLLAKEKFVEHPRITFYWGDFLTFDLCESYDVIIFRTVLHHIIGNSENETVVNQMTALRIASNLLSTNGRIFILENFYESLLLDDITGRLIFELTKLKSIPSVFRKLGANTAGEGVRFRSFKSWEKLFHFQGLKVLNFYHYRSWGGQDMPFWQRIPLVCKRRYQGLLELRPAPQG